MQTPSTEQLRYPIGKFSAPESISPAILKSWIEDIKNLPTQIRVATTNLSDMQLDTAYRPDGWTVRQVVHHVADSHMNSYIRFKLALTENNPTIKPYEEGDWALLSDGKSGPIDLSIHLLESLHARWILLLHSMTDADFNKTFFHPGSQKTISLKENTGVYVWHGKHHVAHITSLRSRIGW
jgi:DinB superfamily